jgi:hypothetical protein
VVFLIDRWDARVKSQQSFDNDLRLFLQEIGTTAGRVIFVSQVPVIRSSNTINLREMVTWRMRAEKKLPRFDPDLNEQLRKQALAAAEAATTSFPNLRVLRPDLCFYREDGSVRYESGRSFFYADGDHLTQAGAELTRDMFRGAIAEATSGSSSQACSVKAGTAAGAKDLN